MHGNYQLRLKVPETNGPEVLLQSLGIYDIGRSRESAEVSVWGDVMGDGSVTHSPAELAEFQTRRVLGYSGKVSGHHAMLTVKGDKVAIYDDGSSNGLFYSGRGGYVPIQERTLDQGKHRLRLGDLPLEIIVEPYSSETKATESSPEKARGLRSLARGLIRAIKG